MSSIRNVILDEVSFAYQQALLMVVAFYRDTCGLDEDVARQRVTLEEVDKVAAQILLHLRAVRVAI